MTKTDRQLVLEVIADAESYNYSLAIDALRAGDSTAYAFYRNKQDRATTALAIIQESN